MGGATVLKVWGGGRSQKKFDPPLFGQWGAKYCLDSKVSLIPLFDL